MNVEFNIKTLTDGVNNALYVYGHAISANYLGCDNPLPQQLKDLPHEELKKRYDEVERFYKVLLKLEQTGNDLLAFGVEGGIDDVDC